MLKWLKTGFGWLKTANQFYRKVKTSFKMIEWVGDVLEFAQKRYAEIFEIEDDSEVEQENQTNE